MPRLGSYVPMLVNFIVSIQSYLQGCKKLFVSLNHIQCIFMNVIQIQVPSCII